MPFVAAVIAGSAIAGAFSAKTRSKAAKRAAGVQVAAAGEASALQKTAEEEALERSRVAEEKSRADLQPFTAAGTRAIGGLEKGLAGVSRLVTDPEAQREFITNNPFFEALTGRATEEIFSNRAARGKVGSGGTAEALQNSLLLLGSSLLNQNVTQRQNVNTQFQNLVNVGQSSATGQANITQGTVDRDVGTITGVADKRSSLRTQRGNIEAAGIQGVAAAKVGGVQTAIDTALGVAGLPQFNKKPPGTGKVGSNLTKQL